MTRDHLRTLARQAGIDWHDDVFFFVNAPEMERWAQLIAQAAPRVECSRCGRILADLPAACPPCTGDCNQGRECPARS